MGRVALFLGTYHFPSYRGRQKEIIGLVFCVVFRERKNLGIFRWYGKCSKQFVNFVKLNIVYEFSVPTEFVVPARRPDNRKVLGYSI